METWDAIRARRDVRQFGDRPISEDDLERILEAGWRAPSASNKQGRDLVVVTERGLLTQIGAEWQGAHNAGGSAAAVALVYPLAGSGRGAAFGAFDQGQAAMAMMVTAADLGIGSGHAAVDDQETGRRLLGYPPDHGCGMLITFGYPAERPLEPIGRPERRPFGEVVHRGHW